MKMIKYYNNGHHRSIIWKYILTVVMAEQLWSYGGEAHPEACILQGKGRYVKEIMKYWFAWLD